LALLIIGCAFAAVRGNVLAGVTIIIAAAVMVSARDLAALIQ
jgi:hypothetical protein